MNDLTLSEIVYPELKTTYRLSHSGRGTNFHIWRSKLDFVLVDNQVNYVLTEPKPDNPNDAARWVADDFKARHIILGTLDDNLYIMYQNHETVKSLMDALTSFFTRPSLARKFTLFKKYRDHRMKEGTNITQQIIKMGAMAKELELEGMEIPQEAQSVLLMESLPDSWHDVVATIKMNLGIDEDGLGLENIQHKLINAGYLKEYYRARDEEEGQSSSSRGGFKGNCYQCGEFGHRKSDCPNFN